MQAVAVEFVTRGHSQRKAANTAGVPCLTYSAGTRPTPPCDRENRRLLHAAMWWAKFTPVHEAYTGIGGLPRPCALNRTGS